MSSFWRERFWDFGGQNLPPPSTHLPLTFFIAWLDHSRGKLLAHRMVPITSTWYLPAPCNANFYFHFCDLCSWSASVLRRMSKVFVFVSCLVIRLIFQIQIAEGITGLDGKEGKETYQPWKSMTSCRWGGKKNMSGQMRWPSIQASSPHLGVMLGSSTINFFLKKPQIWHPKHEPLRQKRPLNLQAPPSEARFASLQSRGLG